MRVVLFVQDDSAAACLAPLAAQQCEVLCVSDGTANCSVFARRCIDLGFNFASLSDVAASKTVVEGFKPELMVFIPDHVDTILPAPFREVSPEPSPGAQRKYVLSAGVSMPGACWPEFAPIWLGLESSRVVLTSVPDQVVASVDVPLCGAETALTLRTKHSEAKAALLATLLEGGSLPLAAGCAHAPASSSKAPRSIALDWDEGTVDRFVRARFFSPRDSAQVTDTSTGEAYVIESMEQYQAFRSHVLRDGSIRDSGTQGQYAADTHWYSNVGGTIVKMGDTDIHMPIRVADKKRPAVVPGAALGARKKLRMNEPLIGPNAERYCSQALASGWIGVEGPYVRQFERQLARICGCEAACAVHSGTAALYGAMKALGVSEATHHVLVPSFTCAACADAVVHAGGRPVPIDCEMDSYGLSLEAVRKAIEGDTNVVGVVIAPCYGVPARDFHAIHTLCKERGIWLCEDACESFGAAQCVPAAGGGTLKVPVGALATLTVISVRSEKMIGVGEGGAILGNDTSLVANAKWWCSRAPCRGVGLWRVYEHAAVGQNFRLPEMLAAVGCAAAEMLPVMIERKTNIHAWYEAGFRSHPELQGVALQKCSPGDEAVWWITAALMPAGVSGEKVGMRLVADYPDIEIRPGFFPLNLMAIFKSSWTRPCPNAERLYDGLVCLPSSNQLAQEDVERICSALAASLSAVKAEGSG